jgi:sterol 3beta-glucosyltransferase
VKIVLIAHGSRGDVQPMLALSWALARRGHDATLVTSRDMLHWPRAAGIACAPLPFDTRALIGEPATRRMFARGDLRGLFARFVRHETDHRVEVERAIVEAVRGADTVVATGLAVDAAAAVGAARRIPVVPVYFAPFLPSSAFPSPFVSVRPSLGPLNRVTHDAVFAMKWRSMRRAIGSLRDDLGVASVRECFAKQVLRRGLPCLLAYSGAIAPRARDWGTSIAVTGALRMPPVLRERLGEQGLSDELARWLDAGPAPLFLGFGSMPVLAELMPLAREVVKGLGARAVVGAGWSKVPIGHDEVVFAVDDVDHTALFPRCIAAVHHGGAGTTHEGLRAGLPTVVCPVFGDQRFWGARCRALGVGGVLPFPEISAGRLRDTLGLALAAPGRRAARELSRVLVAEDGLAEAVHVVESLPRDAFPE